MVFVKMLRELFQAVLGEDDVTPGVLGSSYLPTATQFGISCRFFMISHYELLVF